MLSRSKLEPRPIKLFEECCGVSHNIQAKYQVSWEREMEISDANCFSDILNPYTVEPWETPSFSFRDLIEQSLSSLGLIQGCH